MVAYKHLSAEKRYLIYIAHSKGLKQTEIASMIGVNKSTISRELHRNKTENNIYVWDKAQKKAEEKQKKSATNRQLPDIVKWQAIELLTTNQWSPQQISGYLKKQGISISHKTIYKIIHADETGELKKHCRHKLKYRRHRHPKHITKATNIRNRTSIHERPTEADGTRFGDWEMDLIVDGHNNCILTMIERSTDYLLMHKLANKQADTTARMAWRLLLPYKEKILTITTDNGSEFANHEWLSKRIKIIPSPSLRCYSSLYHNVALCLIRYVFEHPLHLLDGHFLVDRLGLSGMQ